MQPVNLPPNWKFRLATQMLTHNPLSQLLSANLHCIRANDTILKYHKIRREENIKERLIKLTVTE